MSLTVDRVISNANNMACGVLDAIIDIAEDMGGNDNIKDAHNLDMAKSIVNCIDYKIGSPEVSWEELEKTFSLERQRLYDIHHGRLAGYVYTMRAIRNIVSLLRIGF